MQANCAWRLIAFLVCVAAPGENKDLQKQFFFRYSSYLFTNIKQRNTTKDNISQLDNTAHLSIHNTQFTANIFVHLFM